MNSLYKEFGPGRQLPVQNTPSVASNVPFPYLQSAMQRAQQIMQSLSNPQQFVLQNFNGIPSDIQNNPDQIIEYLRQNENRLNPAQRQALHMMSGR